MFDSTRNIHKRGSAYMRRFFYLTITYYQACVSPILKASFGTNRFCRFSPSCSQYTKEAILEVGVVKGVTMGLRRIIHCNPFVYDRNF